jgi:hypothetical protein
MFSAGALWRMWVLPFALALACGGNSSSSAQHGGRAGDGNGAGETGRGGEGGGGQAGGAAGFPCGTATPLFGADSGLERCDRGYLRRVDVANCPSIVPRAVPISNYDEAVDDCEFDRDCPTAAYGPYAHCDVRTGGFARACVAGCKLDGDCAEGEACLCGDPVGRCVPASCATGADCATSLDCASYAVTPGCFSTGFSCQKPGDSCGGDADCAGISPNPAFCVFSDDSRACSIAQCTTP